MSLLTTYSEKPKARHAFEIDYLEPMFWEKMSGRAPTDGQKLLKQSLLGNLKPHKEPISILDATAGFLRDSLLFCSWGCQVFACEKVASVVGISARALERAKAENVDFARMANRLLLIHGDSIEWMKDLRSCVDIVYLDPMFLETKGSSVINKDMPMLRKLIGNQDQKEELLLMMALGFAKKRVLVKRPIQARPLAEHVRVTNSYWGKNVRYDLYIPNAK